MRVLYLINGLGTGGAERSLAEMLGPLREAGVDVSLGCLHRRADGVERHVVAAGFPVRFIEARSWGGRIAAARRLIRDTRPDLVHTTIYDSDQIGRVAARSLGVPVVSSLVNTNYDRSGAPDPNVSRWKLAAARAVDGWTARRLTTGFHAVSSSVRDAAVAALRIDADRVTVVPRGRDRSRLGFPSAERRARTRLALGVAADAEVVLSVGRQEYQKGQADLLRAVQQLVTERPALQVLLVGREGNATPEIRELAGGADLSDRVRLLGHRDDVPDLLAASDVFAFPSYFEGAAGALIEAMALGLPAVTTDVPALREAVEPGRTALLVRPGDAAALAAALRTLLDDAPRRGAMGARGQQVFEERYTLDRSVAGMVALYRGYVGT